MLKRKQALVHFDCQRRVAVPDRLRRKQHADYLGYAQRMLRIYETGNGCTRRELHRRVEAVFEHVLHCPPRRIEAFQKLLDDASEYQTNRAAGAAQLRQQVFSRAANYHPLVSHPEGVFCNSEQGIKSKIAAELNRSWNEIDSGLCLSRRVARTL
jgi:predicted nuclease of restriction endonuclease-like RecB superfamily